MAATYRSWSGNQTEGCPVPGVEEGRHNPAIRGEAQLEQPLPLGPQKRVKTEDTC